MSHLTNCNFIVRMLFCDSYWLYWLYSLFIVLYFIGVFLFTIAVWRQWTCLTGCCCFFLIQWHSTKLNKLHYNSTVWQTTLKEEERLCAVIADIDHDVRVAPRAAYIQAPNGQIRENCSFNGRLHRMTFLHVLFGLTDIFRLLGFFIV